MKIYIASGLLVLGVGSVAATAETGVIWYSVAGYLALLLVPPMIHDALKVDQE